MSQLKTLTQRILGTTRIVAPCVFSHFCTFHEVYVHFSLKGTARKVYLCVITHVEPQVDTLVYGKACNYTMLMVHMRSYGTNSVWREYMICKRLFF